MNEFDLIRQLTRHLATNDSVVAGPGDDCAVLDLGLPDRFVLFKTDAVVENIHFQPEADPVQIGHKALARPLSDFAAMAGTPSHALVTLGLPGGFDPGRAEDIYQGLNALAARHHVAIVGGETTALPERWLLSVSVLGFAPKHRCILRSGSQPGDALFVTGTLGGSLAGKHLTFEPRLDQARWLAEQFDLHAMIDLSDGLAGDLRHLLNAAGHGAELHAHCIPISKDAKRSARTESSAKPPLLAALTDGEDFELLFALPPSQAVPLLDAWKLRFPDLPLTCIGKITSAPGLILRDKDGPRPLNVHGFTHFS